MIKRGFIIMLLLASVSTMALAEGNIMFEKANALYHSENYDSAAKLYTQLVQNGYSSDDLYYNMGNAFYRAEKIGWAIWSFRKSMALDKDKYTLDNYRLAKNKIKNPLLEQKEIFFLRWWRALYSTFSVNGWAIFALASFVVFLILTFLRVVSKKRVPAFMRYLFFAFFVSSFLLMFVQYHNNINHYEAVLVDVASFVQLGSEESDKIPEGSEIRIVDSEPSGKDGQVLIRLSDLREGYILKQTMKRL